MPKHPVPMKITFGSFIDKNQFEAIMQLEEPTLEDEALKMLDDLVKESSYQNDFTYSLKGRSVDPPGWRIEFKAKPEMVGLWERIELVVSEDGKIPLLEEFYDRKNRLSRVMVFDQIVEFDGRRMPSRLTVTPTRETGKWTEVKYLDIDFNIDVPENTFSLSRLERKRR